MPIVGAPPSLINLAQKCAFYPRCPQRTEQCAVDALPELKVLGGDGHAARCYMFNGNGEQ